MMKETLLPGLIFSKKNKISRRETEILLFFFDNARSVYELSEILGIPYMRVYDTVRRLKSKGLIEVKYRDPNGSVFYQFNVNSLE